MLHAEATEKSKTVDQRLFQGLLLLAPTFALYVKHWAAVGLFALSALAIYGLVARRKEITKLRAIDWFLIFTLVAPTLSVALGQLFRSELLMRDFDAPSRILMCIPILFYVANQPFKLHDKLLLGVALALLISLVFIDPETTRHFGNRFSTRYADVNTFGSYLALFMLLILPIAVKKNFSISKRGLFIVCFIVGGFVLTGTESRGAWLAFLLGLLVMPFLGGNQNRFIGITFVMITLIAVGLSTVNNPDFRERTLSIFGEPHSWIAENNEETSGGVRLSLFKASYNLIREKPFSGYGDFGYRPILERNDVGDSVSETVKHALITSGPHSEILARSLQSGIWGFVACFLLYLVPFFLFLSLPKGSSGYQELRMTGILFSLGLIILQFTIEPYSLKFTASLNSVILATLIGEAIKLRSRRT